MVCHFPCLCLWMDCGMSFPLSLSVDGLWYVISPVSVCGWIAVCHIPRLCLWGIVVCHFPCLCLWRIVVCHFLCFCLSVEGLWFVISLISEERLRSVIFPCLSYSPSLSMEGLCSVIFPVYACGAIAICHFLCLYLSVDGRGLSYPQSFSVEGLWFDISLVSVCGMIALCHFPFFM